MLASLLFGPLLRDLILILVFGWQFRDGRVMNWIWVRKYSDIWVWDVRIWDGFYEFRCWFVFIWKWGDWRRVESMIGVPLCVSWLVIGGRRGTWVNLWRNILLGMKGVQRCVAIFSCEKELILFVVTVF